jgi:hypothetical protein
MFRPPGANLVGFLSPGFQNGFIVLLHSTDDYPARISAFTALYFRLVAWYIPSMKKSSLLLSNPYLKDPAVRDALLRQTVVSSSAMEGASKALARRAPGVPFKAATFHHHSRRSPYVSYDHRDL